MTSQIVKSDCPNSKARSIIAMLPPTLFSSYTQYKQDTNSVAAWLASTAKAYGYASDLNSETSKPSGRLKGKARAQARKEAMEPHASVPKHIIKIKDFIPLAEFIALKPKLSVPTSFKDTLDRVIAKRSGFSGKLEQHRSVPDKKSDESHKFFVGILKRVRDILKPCMASTPSGAESQRRGVSNKFAPLDIHEPSEEFLNAPDVSRPSNAQGDKAIYEVEAQTSLPEFMLALAMIINDLNRIRSYVMGIWTNYKDGILDLTAAAIATNTAIDLGRNLTEDIAPAFKIHGGT